MLLAALVACSETVAETSSRKAKIGALAETIRQLRGDELAIGVGFLSGAIRQGRIGVGYATVMKLVVAPAAEPSLTLTEVDATLTTIAETSGKGSTKARADLLGRMLARATMAEQPFLRALLVGELRQGALAGILNDAIAKAAEVPAASVRRAVMLSGDHGRVARAALEEGEPALGRFALELFRPLMPMLAQPCDDADEAIGKLGEAAVELKMDGARVQVHKRGDEVAVYTRKLKVVTKAVPEVVALARALPAEEIVLDGEVIALMDDGRPHAFQTTMRRFGRKLNVASERAKLPLSTFFFDCLHVDGTTLIDEPTNARVAAMREVLPGEACIERIVTADAAAAQSFLRQAIDRGHEGVMAKALDAPYLAGNRGASWLKVKPAHTLDLVVLAAEWGHGRRTGWLSNIHLGARNPDGSFTMLGKTFKGMTDAMLKWQTERFLALEIGREGHVVHVRPEVVVEVALAGVQESPHYPGGLALRLARVKRYRDDKSAAEADTLATVQAIHRGAPPPA